MISFRNILTDIVEHVGGALGGVIMGYDGIAIDEYIKERTCDIQLLAVEYASLLKEVKRTAEVLKSGGMDEITITTARTNVIVRIINDDFFILLALDQEGNYGKGRFLLRRAVPRLREGLQ